jgi:hypothetical protein
VVFTQACVLDCDHSEGGGVVAITKSLLVYLHRRMKRVAAKGWMESTMRA